MLLRLCKSGVVTTLAAIIHVKLTGEGDFGPVDLECAIPPARLPVVMAALFGQPLQMQAGQVPLNMASGSGRSVVQSPDAALASRGQRTGAMPRDRLPESSDDTALGGAPAGGLPHDQSAGVDGFPTGSVVGVDPGAFITSFMGSLGDLIGRLQPRGFAETILIAAIWLHYRDGRGFVTRDDIRRILRRQDHLRMPRNFSRDFHVAVMRGYLDPIESEDGFAVSPAGYQWFRSVCTK